MNTLTGWWATLLRCLHRPARPALTLELDEQGVRCRDATAERSVRWAELAHIEIVTTDDGPFADDLFWMFEAVTGELCVVPGSLVDGRLFDRLALLDAVDYGAIILAQGSTDHARFTVWKR